MTIKRIYYVSIRAHKTLSLPKENRSCLYATVSVFQVSSLVISGGTCAYAAHIQIDSKENRIKSTSIGFFFNLVL